MFTLRCRADKVLDKVQNFNFRWSEVLASAEEGVCVFGVVDVPWRCLVSVTKVCEGVGI